MTIRRICAALGLLVLASSLSACIVVPERGHGGGWCFWHPGACR